MRKPSHSTPPSATSSLPPSSAAPTIVHYPLLDRDWTSLGQSNSGFEVPGFARLLANLLAGNLHIRQQHDTPLVYADVSGSLQILHHAAHHLARRADHAGDL